MGVNCSRLCSQDKGFRVEGETIDSLKLPIRYRSNRKSIIETEEESEAKGEIYDEEQSISEEIGEKISTEFDTQQIQHLLPQTKPNESDLKHIMAHKYDLSYLMSDESSYDDTERMEIEQLKNISSDGYRSNVASPRKKAELLRAKSRDEWQEQDVIERIQEYKKEITHLSSSIDAFESMDLQIPIVDSAGDADRDESEEPIISKQFLNVEAGTKDSNLFRLESANKWNNTKKEALREEFAKHMMHLASNNGVSLPPSLGIDDA